MSKTPTFASVMAPIQVNTDELVQEEILRAALRLYQKLGLDKVTMDDVAKATGRSRTSLYYYYKNRDEIFQAVLDTLARDVAAEIRAMVNRATTLSDKMYAFCMAKLKTWEDWKPVLGAIWAAVDTGELPKHGKAMEIFHKKLMYQEAIIISEIVATTAGKRGFRPLSAGEQDTLVFVVSSGIRGLRREVFDLGDPHDIKIAVQLLTDMIVKWLKT